MDTFSNFFLDDFKSAAAFNEAGFLDLSNLIKNDKVAPLFELLCLKQRTYQ